MGQVETLVRELEEELRITPAQWTYMETLEQPAVVTVHLYLVTAWIGSPVNRQPHREAHNAIGWFSLAQAAKLNLADLSYSALFGRYLTER